MIDLNQIRKYIESQLEQQIPKIVPAAGSRKNTVEYLFPIPGVIYAVSFEVSISKLNATTTEDIISQYIRPQINKIKGSKYV